MLDTSSFPDRVLGFYDIPMWQHLEQGIFKLQSCANCGDFRYPPGPVCPGCLSPEYEWTEVGGGGEVLSYATFHKGYLPGYEPPYSVAAIRLDEGPIMVSSVQGADSPNGWIGRRVRLVLVRRGEQYVLPCFEFA